MGAKSGLLKTIYTLTDNFAFIWLADVRFKHMLCSFTVLQNLPLCPFHLVDIPYPKVQHDVASFFFPSLSLCPFSFNDPLNYTALTIHASGKCNLIVLHTIFRYHFKCRRMFKNTLSVCVCVHDLCRAETTAIHLAANMNGPKWIKIEWKIRF